MSLLLNRMRTMPLIVLSLIFFICTSNLAQEAKPEAGSGSKKVYRPDIPGSILVDFGVNGTAGAPVGFEKGWFGSRTFNVYYYYPMRLGNSKITVNAGLGLGMDRFKFTNRYYLADTAVQDGRFELVPSFVDTDGNDKYDSITFPGLKKSLLSMTYLDVPLEFRYNVNPDDPNRTFWVAVGGRAGWMIGANSKIKRKFDGDRIVHKDRYRQGLNQFRYGVSLRIGIGNFNFFGFYNLSPLFEKGKGPSQTQMTTFTTGISLVGL
jgi:outer membrane protein with beta-barrel domain